MVSTRLSLLAVLGLEFAAAAGFFPALRLPFRWRLGTLVVLCLLIALAPLLITTEQRSLRFLATLIAFVLCAKLYDVHVGVLRGERPGLRTFLLFLMNLYRLVLRRTDASRSYSKGRSLVHLGTSLAGSFLAFAALERLFRANWSNSPFLVEHSVKAVVFFVGAVPLLWTGAALTRLVGGNLPDPTDAPYLARTPADFWRRYNRAVHQFFYEDVFKPLGGRRAPVRVTLFIFATTGLAHEYMVTIATGRVLGYQILFFMLQGIAVAATLRVKPKGLSAIIWIVGTLGFNLLASVLFFTSLDGMILFYSG